MIKKILAATACAMLALPAFAQQGATATTGFYGGLDVGRTHLGYSGDNTSAGLYGGYQFNRYLGAELGFRRLAEARFGFDLPGAPGAPQQAVISDVRINQQSLSLLGRYPVADKLDLIGRVGYNRIDYRGAARELKAENEALVGVGASYALTPKIDLRFEAQRAQSHTTNYSIGAGYRF